MRRQDKQTKRQIISATRIDRTIINCQLSFLCISIVDLMSLLQEGNKVLSDSFYINGFDSNLLQETC